MNPSEICLTAKSPDKTFVQPGPHERQSPLWSRHQRDRRGGCQHGPPAEKDDVYCQILRSFIVETGFWAVPYRERDPEGMFLITLQTYSLVCVMVLFLGFDLGRKDFGVGVYVTQG